MAATDYRIRITLDRPIYGGYFLGRHNGKAVMVPYGIPGETVVAEITEDKKDFCFASIIQVAEKNADRIDPECPYYARCGGCAYLHVDYERELDFKKTILEDSLARIAGLTDDLRPSINMVRADRFHYRSHATIKAKGGVPGFYRKATNDFVSIRESGCLLAAPELNSWLMDRTHVPNDCRIAVDSTGRVISSLGKDQVVVDSDCGFDFARSLGCFYQANRLLRERMIRVVTDCAGLKGSEAFLDMGCGVGFFTLPLARCSESGTGIDLSAETIKWAKFNAERNAIRNTGFLAMPSNRIHPGRTRADLIVADPPRAGLDKNTRKTIMAIKPATLVYVSCNPATFSRDTKDFLNGGYFLDKLTLIDMFPGTHHIEVISRFVRTAISRSS